jgi:hypothetical protein
MTLYVLDADVLITARDQHYGFRIVPEFWEWLLHCAEAGTVKVPWEVLGEVTGGADQRGKDPLLNWASDRANRDKLDLGEAKLENVAHVLTVGYSPTLTPEQIALKEGDAFVLAHALADPQNRCVVSNEVSAPGKAPWNRRLPDAAKVLGVRCINTVQFVREAGFCTMWKMLM